MKRIVLLLFAILFASIANAQWNISYREGDELRGTQGGYFNFYRSSNGDSFSFGSGQPIVFIISTKSGIFDYEGDYGDYHTLKVLIGYYEGAKLVDKATEYLIIQRNGNADYAGSASKELGNKVANHLKTVGDVRIIAPKYSGSDYDVRIPMNPDLVIDDLEPKNEMTVKDDDIIIPKLSK